MIDPCVRGELGRLAYEVAELRVAIPLRDRLAFDVAFAAAVLYYLDGIEQAANEVLKARRSGGGRPQSILSRSL